MSNRRRFRFIVYVDVVGEVGEVCETAIGQNLAAGIRRQYNELGIVPKDETGSYVERVQVTDQYAELIEVIEA